jgi:hypothetical protein
MEKELRMDVVADQILLRSKRQPEKIDMSICRIRRTCNHLFRCIYFEWKHRDRT